MPAPQEMTAAEGESIETSDPLEDLEGAVIGGKQFSLDNYTWDLNGVPQLIYFAEVGYSMWTDNREDYALYAYIYNPAGLIFDEDSESNKIELAFGSGGYEKILTRMAEHDPEFLKTTSNRKHGHGQDA